MGMVAGVFTYELSDLLINDSARSKLKLTDVQKENIKAIIDSARAATARIQVQHENPLQLTQEQWDQRRRDMRSIEPLREEQMWETLDAKQTTLARNILFQLNGELSFAYPKIAEQFNITADQLVRMKAIAKQAVEEQRAAPKRPQPYLTEEQKITLAEIQTEQIRRIRERRRAGEDPSQPEQDADLREAREKIYPPLTDAMLEERIQAMERRGANVRERIREVLSAEQKQQWAALPGPKADSEELDAIKHEFSIRRLRPQDLITHTT
jgi:hypothetical protein